MITFRTIIPVIILVVYLILPTLVSCSTPMNAQSVEDILKAYCEGDFTGIMDMRIDLVKFSPEQVLKERTRDHLFGGRVIYWDGDPLFVVESYKIIEVKMHGNRAEALISYERLARSNGDGVLERQLIADHDKSDIVKIDLIYEANRWWVLDPPLPRISRKAIIKYYEDYLKIYEDNWLERKDITEIQKRYVYKRRETLEFLKKLK